MIDGLPKTMAIALVALSIVGSPVATAQPAPAPGSGEAITVRTESLEVEIALTGGAPRRWSVIDPGFVRERDEGGRVELYRAPPPPLKSTGPPPALPLSVWVPGETLAGLGSLTFRATRSEGPDGGVRVELEAIVSEPRLRVRKTYEFPRTGFEVKLKLELENVGDAAISFESGLGLSVGPGLGEAPEPGSGVGSGLYTYVEPLICTSDGVESLEFEDATELAREAGESGFTFGGVHNRYFAMCVIPRGDASFVKMRATLGDGDGAAAGGGPGYPAATFWSKPVTLDAGAVRSFDWIVFGGPKQGDILSASDAGLDDLLFSGLWNWLRGLCFAMLWVLAAIHQVVPNWGLAILALALVVRLIIFPFSHKGMKSQNLMLEEQARLRPQIAAIEKKHKGDYMTIHEETMKLYRENGVNPYAAFTGCFWVLLQLPIFTTLFNLLGQAYELRGVSFLYIEDLAQPDRLFPFGATLPFFGSHFNLLPVLMALTMVVTTGLGARPGADKSETAKQMRTMGFLAVVFFALFYSFPAGLVLYWTASNVLQFVHQKLAHGRVAAPAPAKAAATIP